jgi:uncharacterized protein YdhG (YjbR/CyaY superfamily)
MQSGAKTVDEYISELPEERKEPISKLREAILKNLPSGFEETMAYGMIGFVVPHSIYPAGYHCTPEQPLPFLSIASQKNFIALYHMGIYADENLLNWFVDEFKKLNKSKLDMGKSCIRFKKMNAIPYELIAELSKKITVKNWIETYERLYVKKK